MNNLDDHLIPPPPIVEETINLAWWEARRPYYNAFLVLMIGLMIWQLFPMAQNFGWGLVLFWSFIYVMVANIFYCLGFLLPLLCKHYFRTDFGLATMASILFNLGVVISLLTTSGIYLWWLLPFRG